MKSIIGITSVIAIAFMLGACNPCKHSGNAASVLQCDLEQAGAQLETTTPHAGEFVS